MVSIALSKWPLWLKLSVLLPAALLALFLAGGVFAASANNWACSTPPCSAGSGYCEKTLGGCFTQENDLAFIPMIPLLAIFLSVSVITQSLGIYVSNLSDLVFAGYHSYDNVLGLVAVSFFWYFVITAAIGLIVTALTGKKS